MSPSVTRQSTVCALIPHFECEEWLAGAIESLLEQTRPPDAVVVMDDCSQAPPISIVAAYPTVSLVSAERNVGPYRLVQEVIERTDFDAYLFQDADDWSAPDRLELLLAEAELTGAELVGSHEVRVLVDEAQVRTVTYPLDVNGALAERPSSFPLLHPTSLVARSLVSRLGGFATGLRYSGDAEFLRRAAHAARVVNVDRFAYFRRKRSGSLTTAPETALESPARLALRAELAAVAEGNAARRRRGETLDLAPLRVAANVALEHLLGPPLGCAERRPSRAATKCPAPASTPGPVFLVGAPRSGLVTLAWCLAQHPHLRLSPDGAWLAGLVAGVEASRDGCPVAPDRFDAAFSTAVGATVTATGRDRFLAAHPELSFVTRPLSQLFPHARFVHMVRDEDEVVRSFATSPTEGGVFFTAAAAADYWSATNRAVLRAECVLGSGSILRVSYPDLFSRPEETIQRILGFLGEEYEPACLRPVLGMPVPWSMDEPALPRPGPAAPPAVAGRGLSHGPRSMVDNVRSLVDACVPPEAIAVVASKGDPDLLDLRGRQSWHFPQTEAGVYAGHHPADSDEAVDGLEALQARGGEFLVIPASALWWLEHYEGLADWLARSCRLVGYMEDAGAVWRLGGAPAVVGLPAGSS